MKRMIQKYLYLMMALGFLTVSSQAQAARSTAGVATVVKADENSCLEVMGRISSDRYECRVTAASISYSGVLPDSEKTMRFQGCRVDLRAEAEGYRVSVMREPAYPRRFLTEVQARHCLSLAFEVGELGDVAVAATTAKPETR